MESSVPQKSVYFLGAGASKASDFQLPTMSEFFTEEDFKQDKYPALHKFIGRVFPKVSFKELNLEDVITRLELSIDRFGAFGEHPEPYLYEARREFGRYVRKRLTYLPKTENNSLACEKHEVLLRQPDYYLKWLINSAISAREKPPLVVVVNKDKEVCEKIKKLVGESPEYHNGFCEYIKGLKTAQSI